jgi:altronate hydrolase
MAQPPVIRLSPEDNVVIARATLLPGAPIGDNLAAKQRIPAGHKIATQPIQPGEAVRRYNQIIGFANTPIGIGEHVHTQNMEMGDFSKDYAYGVDAKPTDYITPQATFMGIRRPDGRVATTSAS